MLKSDGEKYPTAKMFSLNGKCFRVVIQMGLMQDTERRVKAVLIHDYTTA